MRDRLKIFGALAVYWMVFFTVARITFLVYEFPLSKTLSFHELLMPLALGLRMDASMASYWLILVGLLFTASPLMSRTFLSVSTGVLVTFLLVLSTLIVVVDLELYRHWGFRMNTTPLMYARAEGVSSASVAALITLPLIFVSLVAGFIFYMCVGSPPVFFRWRLSPGKNRG
ncbi:MAG: hypothetical protein AB7K37_08855 [Cyclobacteriaceae bacterium]